MNDTLKANMLCPSCGREGFMQEKQCACGYHADNSFSVKAGGTVNEGGRGRTVKKMVREKNGKSAENVVIKEIDSWMISFSPHDNCLYLGTPALKSFNLKITLNDLEDLLECMYHQTGRERTMRKLRLSDEEIQEVVEIVYGLVEEKRSKMAIHLSGNELRGIADVINSKLKD